MCAKIKLFTENISLGIVLIMMVNLKLISEMYHKKYKIRIIAVLIKLFFVNVRAWKYIFHWLGSILSFGGVSWFFLD